MRSASVLGASLLVVLATACGDDGGGNNNGSCGDGHVTGSEQCDDGNTTSGDGCSATCQNENGGGTCGDNTVDVNKGEQCDDGNTMSGDGCSATCQTETPVNCGNGMLDGTESCDDNNTANGDGCSSTCTVEQGYTCTGTPSVCTMGGGMMGTCAAPFTVTFTGTGTLTATVTGDTSTATNQVPEAACDMDVAGGGPDNIWKFTLTDTRDVFITLDTVTAFDGGIRVMRAPCDTSMEIIDQVGGDGCSDTGLDGDTPFQEALGYVNLPAGTYYISVDGYTAADMGTYSMTIEAALPTCGDGMLGTIEFCDDGNTVDNDGCTHCTVDTGYNCNDAEPSVCQMEGCGDGLLQTGEACDDDNTMPGDGCDAACQVETGWICDGGEPTVCVMAGCGNGIVEEATEECDDGNMMDGDRCSSSCMLESDVTEAAEPNDTVPQALTAGSHIIRGEFETGDVDLYTFTLTETSRVDLETYFTINGSTADYGGVGANNLFDCTTSDDTMLGVFAMGADVTDDANAFARDSDDGDSYCAYVGPRDGADMDYEPTATPDTTQLAMLAPGTYTIKVSADTLPGSDPVTLRRYMLDLKITPMSSTPVAPVAGDLKINEILAADSTTNDSNCDGSTTGTADEFVELVNVSGHPLDLTGVTIADPNATVFTFAAQASGSLTLDPDKAVVVWAGGTPACPGVTNFFVGSAGTLSLNDGGDTITVATGDTTPVTIATATWGQSTAGVSWNLEPDVTGTVYALHTAVTGAVGNSSAGKKADGTAF